MPVLPPHSFGGPPSGTVCLQTPRSRTPWSAPGPMEAEHLLPVVLQTYMLCVYLLVNGLHHTCHVHIYMYMITILFPSVLNKVLKSMCFKFYTNLHIKWLNLSTHKGNNIHLLSSLEGDMKICSTQEIHVAWGRHEFLGLNKSSCLPSSETHVQLLYVYWRSASGEKGCGFPTMHVSFQTGKLIAITMYT